MGPPPITDKAPVQLFNIENGLIRQKARIFMTENCGIGCTRAPRASSTTSATAGYSLRRSTKDVGTVVDKAAEPGDLTNDATTRAASRFAWGRWAIVALLIAAIVGLSFSGLGDTVWRQLKANQDRLQDLVNKHYAASLLAGFIVYFVVASLSLPFAAVLSLAIGALFGRWVGTVLVSFASSLGATVAMLSSRYLFRNLIQRRFASQMDAINKGVETEGAYYLLSLRMIPIVPFWLINLGIGLTRMNVLAFYLVSQIGMLPATFVYLNAGQALGELESWRGILNIKLILAFTLLGLLPLLMKRVVKLFRRYWAKQ
ncbi:MAG: TVP38/TMEM64 family protein [Gemmataceae bacterium]